MQSGIIQITCTFLFGLIAFILFIFQREHSFQTDTTWVDSLHHNSESHLRNIRQLTFGGENAEAYLSFDEKALVFQATREGLPCDQIFTMRITGEEIRRISNGQGRTTCAYWFPDGEHILYSSTFGAAAECPAPPNREKGYVWKLYPEFDIYKSNADGSEIQRLFSSPGYDAEATISPMGDKIVFTSTRDEDPEIYSMDLDGENVRRLTWTKGYDGGPFFSSDGTRIVYRANHPNNPTEERAYSELIGHHLVRPTRLEIFVMDSDGSNQKQITSNGRANFAPYFHPDNKRIIFSSNLGDPLGRNFDLYLINIDGTGLTRITYNESFDGFPMFTKDGRQLVFCSNRNNAKPGDTNVFVAEWID